MTSKLLNAIITHIFHNLKFLDFESTQSICNINFQSNKTIPFEDETLCKLYGAQASVNNQLFKLVAANLYQEDSVDGIFAFIVQMQDCPIYGCLGFYDDYRQPYNDINESYLLYSLSDSKNWLPTTPFLQATFLAGMEQLKEMSISFVKLEDVKMIDILEDFMISCQEMESLHGE